MRLTGPLQAVPLLRVQGPSVIVMLRRRGASRGRPVLGGSLTFLAFSRVCEGAKRLGGEIGTREPTLGCLHPADPEPSLIRATWRFNMKMVKSLVLGTAASLLAVGTAGAADLPVKAKAVEYVRICSLYGAGFFYIPGTDTCIKLGGYLRMDILGNTNSDNGGNYNGAAGSGNRLRNYYTWRSREDLNIDTRTATEYGVLRTFFDATFSWTTTNANVAGTIGPTQNAGVAGSDTIGVYYAFIQFAGFTLGKAISQFSMPWTNYPANNFDGLVGGGGDVTGVNQVSYTWQFGNGVAATISAQDQVAYYTSNLWNVNAGANVLSGTWGT